MGGVEEIAELRRRIDELDREFLRLLDERVMVARKIGRVKGSLGLNVRDPEREREVLERAGEHRRVFEAILADSRLAQRGRVGVVGGLGRMGGWLAERLSHIRKVAVYDVRPGPPPPGCFRMDSLDELVEWSDVVIVATPLGKTPDVLREVAKVVPDGRLVFDLSTLKGRVVETLTKFPERVLVCSVHPLFGPGAEGLEGRRVAIVPVPGREEGADHTEELFKDAGAVTVRVDLETHDRAVALTVGLMYFVGLSLGLTVSRWGDLKKLAELSGTSFTYLSTYLCQLAGEGPGFVADLLSSPEVTEAIRLYLKTCGELASLEEEGIRSRMREVSRTLTVLSDAESAYSAFYEALRAIEALKSKGGQSRAKYS